LKAARFHYVENSFTLQREQRKAFGVRINEDVYKNAAELPPIIEAKSEDGLSMSWHTHFMTIPDGPLLLVANEFFDTLPIYKFEYTRKGWHEVVIDIEMKDHAKFKLTLAQTSAVAVIFPLQAGGGIAENVVGVPKDPTVGTRVEMYAILLTVP